MSHTDNSRSGSGMEVFRALDWSDPGTDMADKRSMSDARCESEDVLLCVLGVLVRGTRGGRGGGGLDGAF